MNYKDLNIKPSYKSKGSPNITTDFLNPILKHTKVYKRSVGFFSSKVLESINTGIVSLVRNNGCIKLIASPMLNEDDIQAISLGYKQRDSVIENRFTVDFVNALEELEEDHLKLLCELIRSNVLDIKFAVTDDCGIYHDKLGIVEDYEGNVVVFVGSPNESKSGYKNNYEKIRIFKSWVEGGSENVQDEIDEFDSLWNNTNEFVKVYEYKKIAEKKLIEVIEQKKKNGNHTTFKLRDYQERAIQAWVDNNYHGFYVMATGTGKTWTAIYAADRLLKDYPAMIVICAPYKHLVKQWSEDVEKKFPDAKIVLVSSEFPTWENDIINLAISNRYKKNQIIIISTIKSFNSKRFFDAIQKFKGKRLLIVDEAHRFTKRHKSFHKVFEYMLGLSATPYSGSTPNKGIELMEFFGGQVFNLPIEIALEEKYLVPYYYRPIFLSASVQDQESFNYHTMMMASCFKDGKCIDLEKYVKEKRSRLRVISMAEEKLEQVEMILKTVKEKDHFVVYCGDGKLFDDAGNEIRHIQSIKNELSKLGFKSSQFTAKENIQERMSLVELFNKGSIDALAAIRCLDEGINIPSIKSALILSSNDDYREFVQRRGRILRQFEGKENATIYDVVVLPESTMQNWAKIELRRYYEYAKLSLNWDVLEMELHSLLEKYNLTLEDVKVYDYEDMEVLDDE